MEALATQHSGWLDELLAGLQDKYIIFDCPGQVRRRGERGRACVCVLIGDRFSVVVGFFVSFRKEEISRCSVRFLAPSTREDASVALEWRRWARQVELFTVEHSLKHIVERLTRDQGWRLTAVHLVDAHLCSDPFRFLSGVLVSLTAMLQLELPHVNVLSKMDLIERFGTIPFGLEFYLECGSLERLADLTEVRRVGGLQGRLLLSRTSFWFGLASDGRSSRLVCAALQQADSQPLRGGRLV